MEQLIKDLREGIAINELDGVPPDSISFVHQQGILISINEAKKILEVLIEYTRVR